MTDKPIIHESTLDECVLAVLQKQERGIWSTAGSVSAMLLDVILPDTMKQIQQSLERLHNAKTIQQAFNNVGRKSYKVYKVHTEDGETTPKGVKNGV